MGSYAGEFWKYSLILYRVSLHFMQEVGFTLDTLGQHTQTTIHTHIHAQS